MYTFEDWLNGTLGNKDGLNTTVVNNAFSLRKGNLENWCKQEIISENCLMKIRQFQERTFDMAFTLEKQSFINKLEEGLRKADFKYKMDIIKHEIKKWKNELNPKKDCIYLSIKPENLEKVIIIVKKGYKGFEGITGPEYQDVLLQYNNFRDGKSFRLHKIFTERHKVKAILEYLDYLKNFFNPRQVEKGLSSSLSVDALKKIYSIATKANYIQCSEENFLAAFSPNSLPKNFQPIRWMVPSERGKTRGEANKSALRDFISICVSGKLYKKGLSTDVRKLFVDMKYKGITLLKPGLASSYALDFEKMLQ